MPDCAYYMRTGTCGYGSKCRYNHPPDRTTSVICLSIALRILSLLLCVVTCKEAQSPA